MSNPLCFSSLGSVVTSDNVTPLTGEERRRVQELHVGLDCGLVDVVGLGLITCGEGALVGGVHTLVAGVVQVYHRHKVVEEEEKGRKGEQEEEREDQGEETARTWMAMEMT